MAIISLSEYTASPDHHGRYDEACSWFNRNFPYKLCYEGFSQEMSDRFGLDAFHLTRDGDDIIDSDVFDAFSFEYNCKRHYWVIYRDGRWHNDFGIFYFASDIDAIWFKIRFGAT